MLPRPKHSDPKVLKMKVFPLPILPLFWSRLGGEDLPPSSWVLSLESPPVKGSVIHMEADLPTFGLVRTPFTISYTLANAGESVLEFTISADASEAFMFAGHKQVSRIHYVCTSFSHLHMLHLNRTCHFMFQIVDEFHF